MTPPTAPIAAPVRPGRPRDAGADDRILAAALALLAERAYDAVSMADIAAAAGVGRQTIYRRWPGKALLVLNAFADRAARDIAPPDTGALATDLDAFLAATFASLETSGGALRALMAEAQHDPGLRDDLFTALIARRRADAAALLERAKARGEIDASADPALLLDLLYGPMWYRLLVGHGPLDAAFARELAQAVAHAAGAAPGVISTQIEMT